MPAAAAGKGRPMNRRLVSGVGRGACALAFAALALHPAAPLAGQGGAETRSVRTPAAQRGEPERRDWIQLFNGRDLDGWTAKFTRHDLGENLNDTFRVENGVLNHGKPLANPDSTLTLSKQTLDAIQLKQTTMQDAIARGDVKVEGRPGAFAELMGMLVTYPGWFNIITP